MRSTSPHPRNSRHYRLTPADVAYACNVARAVARGYPQLDLPDLESVARLAMVQAAQRFQPRHPARALFTTFAHRAVLGAVQRYAQRWQRMVQRVASVDEVEQVGEPNQERQAQQRETAAAVRSVLAAIEPGAARALWMRHAMEYTAVEVAAMRGERPEDVTAATRLGLEQMRAEMQRRGWTREAFAWR